MKLRPLLNPEHSPSDDLRGARPASARRASSRGRLTALRRWSPSQVKRLPDGEQRPRRSRQPAWSICFSSSRAEASDFFFIYHKAALLHIRLQPDTADTFSNGDRTLTNTTDDQERRRKLGFLHRFRRDLSAHYVSLPTDERERWLSSPTPQAPQQATPPDE